MSVLECNRGHHDFEVHVKAAELVKYTIRKASNDNVVAKRNRWTIGDRLVDTALDIVQALDFANSLDLNDPAEAAKRREKQHEAMAYTFRMMMLIETTADLKALGDAYEYWTRLVSDVQRLLRSWMDSDSRRFRGQTGMR